MSPQGRATNDVVVVVLVGVVVVLAATQPPAPQASQQLGDVPTHAFRPGRALHFVASRFKLHRVLPPEPVRQQATRPALPHVDRAAHRFTIPVHSARRRPAAIRALATAAAHATWSPCATAALHGQSLATCARASATV